MKADTHRTSGMAASFTFNAGRKFYILHGRWIFVSDGIICLLSCSSYSILGNYGLYWAGDNLFDRSTTFHQRPYMEGC